MLLKHGTDIEDEIMRRLALGAEELRAAKRPAVILEFSADAKAGRRMTDRTTITYMFTAHR